MSAEQYTYLQTLNSHERDSHISFDEPTHVYTIDGDSDYISVTTFNHDHFEKFDADKIIDKMMKSKNWCNNKYYPKTKEEILNIWEKNRIEASTSGTKMHLDIEKFYNNVNVYNDSIEYSYFMNFNNDFKNVLTPWRTEMMIWTSEYKLAGSVDMIYKNNDDDTYSIYDWKRSKEIKKTAYNKFANTPCISHLPDANYWIYSLQLNTYKFILERNYDIKIRDLYLVCLHPENKNSNYQRIKVADLTEEVKELLSIRKSNLSNKEK